MSKGIRLFIAVFALNLLLLNLAAQTAAEKAFLKSVPESATESMESLTAYLIKDATSDQEKVRNFYLWLTHHITYDVEDFLDFSTKPIMIRDIKTVKKGVINSGLRNREAVCQGYSYMMEEMCRLANIPCMYIAGFTKSRPSGTNIHQPTHAWNAIQVDGEWKLVDVTWGAGNMNMETLKFIKKFDEQWFMPDPKEFVLSHLPEDPMWQLVDCPIDHADFYADSSEKIQTHLKQDKVCYAFQDSINRYLTLEEHEQLLMTARNSHAFHPKNKRRMFQSYMNYGASIGEQMQVEIASLSIDSISQMFRNIELVYKDAAKYADDKDIANQAITRLYKNQVATYCNKIRELPAEEALVWADKALKAAKKGLNYDKSGGMNRSFGDAYVAYAHARTQKFQAATKQSDQLNLLNKVLLDYKQAKRYYDKVGSEAQIEIQLCEQNIEIAEKNLAILRKK